jgi:hypothetical protein
MRRIAIATALAATLLTSAATVSAAHNYEGRWYRDCGKDTYCRIYIEKTGNSRFKFHFMTTSPSTSDSCEWVAVMKQGKGGVLSASGFTASLDKSGALRTAGAMPTTCGKRPPEDTFKPDDADEDGDI